MKKLFFLIAITLSSSSSFAGECDNEISQLKDGASIRTALQCLNKIQPIGNLPSKAVVAFNSETCPSGWQTFDKGKGRVIVGAGKGGADLTNRKLEDEGGGETQKITIKQMPPHAHAYIDDGVYHNPATRYEGLRTEFYGSSSVGLTHGARTTDTVGGGEEFSIMPPFTVLKYCEKQ